MTYNSRLFSQPRLKAIVEVTDEIASACQVIADALADYESAADLPKGEQAEARDEAREAAWAAMGDLLSDAGRLRKQREELFAEG